MICDRCEKKKTCTAMIYIDIKKNDQECECFTEEESTVDQTDEDNEKCENIILD